LDARELKSRVLFCGHGASFSGFGNRIETELQRKYPLLQVQNKSSSSEWHLQAWKGASMMAGLSNVTTYYLSKSQYNTTDGKNCLLFRWNLHCSSTSTQIKRLSNCSIQTCQCRAKIVEGFKEDHHIVCAFQSRKCLNCEKFILNSKIVEHLSNSCQEFQIQCPLSSSHNCSQVFSRNQIMNHLQTHSRDRVLLHISEGQQQNENKVEFLEVKKKSQSQQEEEEFPQDEFQQDDYGEDEDIEWCEPVVIKRSTV